MPNSKSLLSSGAEKRAAAGMDAGWFQTSVASGSGELPVLLLARSDGARRRVHVQASVLIMEVMV